ncbi:MAG: hypothetical protein NTY98_05745 [Verrucomicrobia bacterium]|nr:hypothetical protein [Verrucomicrobiota bacterium]
MDYLPFLPFFVMMVFVCVIHHRGLRRVEAAYAKHGLPVPPPGMPYGAWTAFHPQPRDPPDLVEEKRLILKEANGKILPAMIIGMTLVFATVMGLSLFR